MNDGLFKILLFILVSLFATLILKPKSSEYAFLVSLAAACVALLFILSLLNNKIADIKNTIEELGVDTEYFTVALKAVGIGYITSFVAESCKDAGQNAMAAKAELAGKVAIFTLTIPMITEILKTAVGFING